MLRRQGQAEHPFPGRGDLGVDISGIVGELFGQASAGSFGQGGIRHRGDAPKYNDTAKMQRPLPCLALSLVVYAERRLIAGADGVNLVSFLRTVEVELSVSLIVPVVDGQAVGVAILPQQ